MSRDAMPHLTPAMAPRLQEPHCAVLILNRLSSKNYCRLLTTELEFLVKDRFLLLKEAGGRGGRGGRGGEGGGDGGGQGCGGSSVCLYRCYSWSVFCGQGNSQGHWEGDTEVSWHTPVSATVAMVSMWPPPPLPTSVLRDGKVTCSATAPPAPTQHTPPATPKGRQSAARAYNNGSRQHEKRKRGSLSASEQTMDQAALHHSTGKTRTPKTSAQRDRGVPADGVVHADTKHLTQRGMLSLEEVERKLCTHSLGGTSEPTVPPTKPLPHTSHSQAAVDILSIISPPHRHPLPPVVTPPSPALPSPVIGTSEDFPDNPPLMVSAGMKSGPVDYTPSKSPPLSNHHGNQTYSTGHHSDSELIGPPKQGRAEEWGGREVSRDRGPAGDQVGGAVRSEPGMACDVRPSLPRPCRHLHPTSAD